MNFIPWWERPEWKGTLVGKIGKRLSEEDGVYYRPPRILKKLTKCWRCNRTLAIVYGSLRWDEGRSRDFNRRSCPDECRGIEVPIKDFFPEKGGLPWRITRKLEKRRKAELEKVQRLQVLLRKFNSDLKRRRGVNPSLIEAFAREATSRK